MCQKGEIGGFSYERQNDGTFIYKSKNPSQPIPKLKLKDQPQYKVINSMEDEFKKSGKKIIQNAALDILKFLQDERQSHQKTPSSDSK